VARRVTELDGVLTPRMIEALLNAHITTVEEAWALGPLPVTHWLQRGKPWLGAREIDQVLRVLFAGS
jgi:hypothetical protein